jgi:hypothetical protein
MACVFLKQENGQKKRVQLGYFTDDKIAAQVVNWKCLELGMRNTCFLEIFNF